MSNTNSLKPQYGWTVSVFLPIIPFFAKKFTKHGISANFVSWLSLIVFLIGIPFYYFGSVNILYRIVAAFFFSLGTFFDVLDGAVARLSNTSSKNGALVDSIIDIIRYNIFFTVFFLIVKPYNQYLLVFIIYVAFLNMSFLSYIFTTIFNEKSRQPLARNLYDNYLPVKYKNFCLKHKLLFNPLNIEDQLLFLFFIIGVIFKIELFVLIICFISRLIDLILIIFNKIIKK